MDEQPAHDDERTGPGPLDPQAPGVPRWVRGSLLVIAVLVALLLLLHVTGLAPQHGAGHKMQHAQGRE